MKYINTVCGQNVEFLMLKYMLRIVTNPLYRMKLPCISCATFLVLCTIPGNDILFEDVSSVIPLLPTRESHFMSFRNKSCSQERFSLNVSC